MKIRSDVIRWISGEVIEYDKIFNDLDLSKFELNCYEERR